MPADRHIRGPFVKVRANSTYPMTDSNVPSWEVFDRKTTIWRKKPIGISALLSPTGHSRVHVDISREANVNTATGSISVGNSSFPLTAAPNDLRSAADSLAVIKVRSKIKDQKWNLALFVAELPATANFFLETIRTLVRTYKAVKQGKFSEVHKLFRRARNSVHRKKLDVLMRSSKDVARKWLMWRYAVSPLVYDLDDMLAELYAQRVKPLYHRVAGGSGDMRYVLVNGPGGFKTSGTYHAVRGAYIQANPNQQVWAQLGLINLAATLWEVTPFSLVVDWFLPVGDKLETLDALVGVYVATTWGSTNESIYGVKPRTQSPHMGQRQTYPYDWTVLGIYTSGQHEYKAKAYNRVANPGLSIPALTYTSGPTMKRFTDGLAFIRTAMRR